MPVHPSIATAIDKARLASTTVYLALLEIDVLDPTTRAVINTLRYVHNNEAYSFGGQTYQPAPFDFSVTRAKNEIPRITLSIRDVTLAVQGLMQEYDGGVDFPVRLRIVSTANPGSAEFEESFIILAANADSESYAVNFDLGAENPLSLRFPTRLQFRDRCFWRYKGVECGYTGGLPTCDYTRDGPNGCAAHANTARFGGFPGIRRRNF